jgi:hypothetical protein
MMNVVVEFSMLVKETVAFISSRQRLTMLKPNPVP